MSTGTQQSGDVEAHQFLTRERVADIAKLAAPLLRDDLSWVERRRETVTLLDETALRRQVSVDFSLRSATAKPLLPSERNPVNGGTASSASGADPLWSAPVFVVAKTAGNLMAFDLEDEEGKSLRLLSRADNARISAAALVEMARLSLEEAGEPFPEDLKEQLERVAISDAPEGKQIAKRLKTGTCPTFTTPIGKLREDHRFCWWLATLAHSSIVVVLYRWPHPGRKLIKLRFEEPLAEQPKLRNRLGWRPYRVGIDSSLIEARSYHFEAEAPRGLRITEARLADTEAQKPVTATGFLKRVHLYRPAAQRAGAGTSTLWLLVSGGGFIGGALLASFLTLAVIAACLIWAENIAANPTSAPALLLVLPGLIASYVARPDHHALTTNLLFAARLILMGSAACAYVAAARVALAGGSPTGEAEIAARADSLRTWMCWLSFVALLAFGGLSFTWWRARTRFRGIWKIETGFSDTVFLPVPRERLFQHLRAEAELLRSEHGYSTSSEVPGQEIQLIRTSWSADWFLTYTLDDSDGDTLLRVDGECIPRRPRTPVITLMLRREANRVQARLQRLEEWAATG